VVSKETFEVIYHFCLKDLRKSTKLLFGGIPALEWSVCGVRIDSGTIPIATTSDHRPAVKFREENLRNFTVSWLHTLQR